MHQRGWEGLMGRRLADHRYSLTLTVEQALLVKAGLLRQLQDDDACRDPEVGPPRYRHPLTSAARRQIGELIWLIERSGRPGILVEHSSEAIAPEGARELPKTEQPPVAGDSPQPMPHYFTGERQLPGGEWVSVWTQETQRTIAWRGRCGCGWRGGVITGDAETGLEDDNSRERAFRWWQRSHVDGEQAR